MSIHSLFVASLPLQAGFSGVCVLSFLLYQLAWIASSLLVSSVFLSSEEKDALVQFSRRGLVGKFLGFLFLLFNTCMRVLSIFLQTCVLVLYSCLPLLLIAAMLSVLESRWGDSAVMLGSMLNNPESPIAQTIQITLRVPFQILNTLAFYVLPAYNLVLYVLFNLPLEILVHFVLGQGGTEISKALRAVGDSVPMLSSAAANYVRANSISCPQLPPTCWADACQPVDPRSAADLCLDPTLRALDLAPTLEQLRLACTHVIRGLAVGCESLHTFLNFFLFPITDPHLWKGLGAMLNAVLFVLVGAPTSTTARCALAGGFAVRPSMCTPDFAPAFDHGVTAVNALGTALDNFVDMAYLLVMYGQDAPCPESQSNAVNLDWTQDPIAHSMLGSNTTVLVTLGAGAWALTDGQHAMFVRFANNARRNYYPGLWGTTPVNPRFGIAALRDGNLLGCACLDAGPSLAIQCAVGGAALPEARAFNLTWETPPPEQLRCSNVRVLVQSVRWPQRRVLFAEQLKAVPPSDALLAADAAIYVIPSCGPANLLSCINQAVFTRSNCFPFCMGLHMVAQQQGVTLRGYSSWEGGVLIAARDCVPLLTQPGELGVTSTCSSSAAAGVAAQDSMQCTLNSACTSWVTNRSTYTAQYAANIPAFADTERYVSLVLDGQPLVAAGGTVMRMARDAAQGQHYVDFPSLVGNQYNEFTMEVASPVGIPVTPVAVVPAQAESNDVDGFITVPPNNIEISDLYNPATLSRDAMWYAVNPSYDWLSALAKYCSSKGEDVQVQLAFVSSYSAIRIWRVYYKASACFLRGYDNAHICRSDVATSLHLDPDRDIPRSLGLAVQDCMLGKEFNLLVESVEYFDDLNIVVAVRRGTIQDLAELMTQRLPRGHVVFYFIHTQNLSQVREHSPWAPTFPTVVSGSGVLCPALRFLPSLGTFFARSASAVLYTMRYPINLLSNPFALFEILASRAAGACPAEPLAHTALRDCGWGLLSLDDLFESLYAANVAFWDIGGWVASLFHPGPLGVQGIFERFLTGFSAYGEAGRIVSLYDVTDAAGVFDSGVQDSLMGGRRLLTLATQDRKLLGFKLNVAGGVAKSVGKGLIAALLQALAGSVHNIFAMSQSLTSAMALRASSADFSVLVATENPTYMLASAVSAPTLAWAHFSYKAAVPIALDLAASLVYGQGPSLAGVWVNLYEARDHFHTLISARLERGCSALRLMLGYSGGLPTAVYYNCLSAVDMHSALFELLLIVTAEVPLYHCMCVQSAGQPFPDYILANCMQWVPASRKGLWQSIVLQPQGTAEGLCSWYGDHIHETAQHLLDQWTTDSERAANALASFLQDTFIFQEHPLSCTAPGSPNMFTLLPIPSDHYQICGKTSVCQLRCADAFALFYFELNRSTAPPMAPFAYEISAESPFFNPYQSASSSSLNYVDQRIVALRSQNATSTCPGGSVSIVKAPWVEPQQRFTVVAYCVPPASAIKAMVYASGTPEWSFEVSGASGTLTYCDFALQQPYVLLAYSSTVLSFSQEGMPTTLGSPTTTSARHQLYAVSDSQQHLLLDTNRLSALILTPPVQQALFTAAKVSDARVTQCAITHLLEVATGVSGQLLFFLRLTLTAQAYRQQILISESASVHVMAQWSDPTLFSAADSGTALQIFLPCPCDAPPCQNPPLQTGCRPGLDTALALAQLGTFMHMEGDLYLHIPSDANLQDLPLLLLRIDPSGFHTAEAVPKPPFTSSSYRLYRSSVMRTQQTTTGTWTQADVFVPLSTRQVRSPTVRDPASPPLRWFYSTQTTPGALQWLAEMRVVSTAHGFVLKSYASQNTTASAKLDSKCTPYACAACASPRVRLTCHALQDCMISRYPLWFSA